MNELLHYPLDPVALSDAFRSLSTDQKQQIEDEFIDLLESVQELSEAPPSEPPGYIRLGVPD